nr:tudor domain-containing protein 1-like isoform X2 [Paramormyrops kingsleyae]
MQRHQNPTEFFCHQSSSQGTRTLAALMADLAKHSQSSDAALVASVGRPCCAQFPGDKFWYRAMVQSILPDGKVEVFFVDYGNTCVVDRAELRSIRPEHLKVPSQALRCWLAGDKKWYRAVVLEVGDSEAKVVYADYGNTERVPLSGLQPITSAHLDPPFRIVRCALTGRRFELLLDAPVLACAHGFDGTYNLLTMTSHGEKGNVHINSALKDSLVEEEGPAVGPSEWESAAGPRDAACVPRGCLDKVMGKDGAKADIQQETGREEAELVSGVCNGD